MKKQKITSSFVPNLFTITNLFCGFSAIIYAASQDFERAAIFVFAGAFFDLIDGFAARLTGASSEFGGELDSLSDLVTFGVAPSLMMYWFYFHEFGNIGVLISSFPAMMGALRLARFNIQLSRITSKKLFVGLPIPTNAMVIVSYILFSETYQSYFEMTSNWFEINLHYVNIFLVLIPSLLMVSNVEFRNIPKLNLASIKKDPVIIMIFLSLLIGSLLTAGKYFFIGLLIFVVYSTLVHIKNWFKEDSLLEFNFEEFESPEYEDN